MAAWLAIPGIGPYSFRNRGEVMEICRDIILVESRKHSGCNFVAFLSYVRRQCRRVL